MRTTKHEIVTVTLELSRDEAVAIRKVLGNATQGYAREQCECTDAEARTIGAIFDGLDSVFI